MRAFGGLRVAIAAMAFAAALTSGPAQAQELGKKLNRPFNQCEFPSPYVFDYTTFTATGSETTLTFDRSHIACSDRCQAVPFPPFNSCSQLCQPTNPCPNNWKCSCNSTNCVGQCVAGVDVIVGYVTVVKLDRFCSIAACASLSPPGCPASVCDGSGTCADATSNAKALCMCPDPACPIGQRICDSTRPNIPAGDLDYEAFSSATNPAWVLGQATIASNILGLNGTAITTSLAQTRFPTVPGESYALVVKWSISPIIPNFQSCPDASLSLTLDTRADSCGP